MLNNKFSITLVFVSISCLSWAQSRAVADTSIVQSLENSISGKGVVRVFQPRQLDSLIARVSQSLSGNHPVALVSGYRIQVFSDNNQRTAKSEALSKERQVKELFPDLDTYIIFTAPFWRLRVGDFRSIEEANSKLKELQGQFPRFGKEMRVVRDQVRVLIADK